TGGRKNRRWTVTRQIRWPVASAALLISFLVPNLLAASTCADHKIRLADRTVGDDLSGAKGSSLQIHKHREGVIVPLGPTGPALPLSSINVEATAGFFSCMARNFIVDVRAEFILGPAENNSSNAAFGVAF